MDMGEYRVEVDVVQQSKSGWSVLSESRGRVGSVRASGGGKFDAIVDYTTVARTYSVKAAVEQVIWYDRAMNQEAE